MFDFTHVKLWTAVLIEAKLKIKIYNKVFYLVYHTPYYGKHPKEGRSQ